MEKTSLIRGLLLPAGFVVRLYELAVAGSRDLYNKRKFRGSLIDRGCCIDSTTKIAECCHILKNAFIWDSSIERFTYVGRNSIIQHAQIGSFCSIANDVFMGLGAHPTELFSTSPLFYRVKNTFGRQVVDTDYEFSEYRPIRIGHDVWIGARAIVLDGVEIGDGAIVAANAVVTKDVPPYAVVGGVPAKVLKYRFSPEKIDALRSMQWWSWSLVEIRRRMGELNDLCGAPSRLSGG